MLDELASTLASIKEFMAELQDGGLTWDDRDGILAASLPAKFRMPDIECYSGIVGQLRDSLPSVEPSRLRTWENVAHEFLTQFAFSTDIDVSRREFEGHQLEAR
ncbi:hypothetical protein CK203_048352 [Vitis vinifera]|uniref:Retrotransposon gag domain-containing protein n=1 Tax=Vitis vinifera TaxID=29760 RepID=A0A438HRJ3_VITVI|nr:hypothetical protein CK203_048352 [Vitis vinifera]